MRCALLWREPGPRRGGICVEVQLACSELRLSELTFEFGGNGNEIRGRRIRGYSEFALGRADTRISEEKRSNVCELGG